jgi:hypothetical protein
MSKMNQQLSVLLYSQYSKSSKKLLDIFTTSSIVPEEIGLSTVCIDNEKIRKRILKSNKVKIESVPCILILYNDGGVEKFDGSNAFRWVEDIITQFTPQQPTSYQIPPVNTPPPQPLTQPGQLQQSSLQHTQSIPGGTSIDDLGDLEDIEEDYTVKKPPRGIRSDSGNYDIAEFGSDLETNRTVTRGIKENTTSVSEKPNIVNTAQEMQRMRDEHIEKNRPPGMPLDR